jgi:VWFA-related protein
MLGRRSLQWVALSCFAVGSVYSQTTDAVNPENPVFRAKVPVVLVDVVVTDRNGEPVRDLQKEDFQIFEEGQPQTIASFEEHKGTAAQAMPSLPPNIYTNYPTGGPADSLNIVLLDTLNTPLSDQSKVYLQLASFLKSVPAGSHIAMFTLSSSLQMVEGFTSDAPTLLAALKRKAASHPQPSTLFGIGPVENVDSQINQQLSATGAGEPSAGIASEEKLQQFQNQTQNVQDRLRMTLTLQALQGLANYLTGVRGRKNVIWFSDSFPLSIVPGKGVQNYESGSAEEAEFHKTVNMLAAAQVAIYPIAAEGLDQKIVSNESRVKSVPTDSVRTVGDQQISDVTAPAWDGDQAAGEQDERDYARQDAHHATMYKVATDTGGEAFFNTNGLKQALTRVISDGAHYYTISYSPTDKQEDGRYRPIEVKLLKGDYHLAYRHGYFAEEAAGKKKKDKGRKKDKDKNKNKDKVQEESDPLRPLMISGIPDATQIVYEMRVLPLPPAPPGSKQAPAKDKRNGPLTRYGINFAVLLKDLTFIVTPDGDHQDKIEIAIVAYDQDGIPLNSMVKAADITLNPRFYAAFEKTGLQLHEEIEVPNGGAYLRTGICELATDKAGTLEIPLSQVASSAMGAK